MKKILVLDDEPVRHTAFDSIFPNDQVVHTINYDDFVEALKAGPYDLICLDHDLGGGNDPNGNFVLHKTGLDAAQAILRQPQSLWPKQVLVHSHNSVQGPKMVELLNNAGISTVRKPFQST